MSKYIHKPWGYGGEAPITGMQGAEPLAGFFSSAFLCHQRKVEIIFHIPLI